MGRKSRYREKPLHGGELRHKSKQKKELQRQATKLSAPLVPEKKDNVEHFNAVAGQGHRRATRRHLMCPSYDDVPHVSHLLTASNAPILPDERNTAQEQKNKYK